MSTIDDRLRTLGITLPEPAAPVANYVPAVVAGTLLVISGQLAYGADGTLAAEHKGKVGGGVSEASAGRRRGSARSTSWRRPRRLWEASIGSSAASGSAASSIPRLASRRSPRS